MPINLPHWSSRLVAAVSALLLSACGGGDDDHPPPPACSITEQKLWLRDHLDEWYFWYRLAPRPDPAAFATVDGLLRASLYTGTDPQFPPDRWSTSESTESFNRFFGEGRTLGYGMAVAGLEVAGRPDLPLRVRYVEPLSDAAGKGVRRGDQVVSLAGRPAAELVARDDFSALAPTREGQTLEVVLRDAFGDRRLTLVAGNHRLTPVPPPAIVQTPGGRRVGYLMVKDMIALAEAPIVDAFARFRAAGVQDLVLDLRYNGGGQVSTAALLASHVDGSRSADQPFATLLYNDRRAAQNNASYRFDRPAAALGLARVYVLAGPRTCSASEQVVNGLRPFVDVVLVGDTTCGKPVGSLPAERCGTTYSAIHFETVNARFEGRYFDGFEPTCAVADDLSQPLGSSAEALLATAAFHVDNGRCPAGTARAAGSLPRPRPRVEPGDRSGMLAR